MAKGDAAGSVALDLIPVEMIRPRLRGLAVVAVVIGVLVALVVAIFASAAVAALVGAIIAVPTALSALLAMRRRIWLSGTTVHARTGLRTKSVDLGVAVSAELVVRVARVSQVVLRVGDDARRVAVPLALYTADGGRELEVLALRSLADALVSGDLVPAVAMSDALIGQLRAEARGAGLEERPLYRAVQLARAASRVPETVLTDDEVVRLVE
ncbi:hypothetical protein [Rhodococcus sp. NPDC127528]|uniref:hypothetical protein n=1 Tax=unclassified Rhodococcus (in: high G+C Gram-positive bacteria) TaxID=192944 RepID=UPI00362AA7B6